MSYRDHMSDRNAKLFDEVWVAAVGPPRCNFYTALDKLIDAARAQGRAEERAAAQPVKRGRGRPRKVAYA